MHEPLTRTARLLIGIGLLLSSLMLLNGCPPAKPAGQSGTHTGASATTVPAAVPGSSIVLPLEIAADDPAMTALDLSDPRLMSLARCIALPLVQSMGDGSQQPGLADEWSSSDGGITWVFQLKSMGEQPGEPGYLGNLFTTHCKQILNARESPLRAQLTDLIQGAAEYQQGSASDISGLHVDDGTLTVALTRPNQFFPAWVSQPGLGVLENADLASAHGYGPWCVGSYNSGDSAAGEPASIALKPNPASVAGQPVAGTITFLLVPDREEQLKLFTAGKLHAANLRWQDVPDAEQQHPGQFRHLNTAVPVVGQFDLHQFPWGEDKFQSKLGLRQAVNWSIDREYLAEMLHHQITGWPYFFPESLQDLNPPGILVKPTYPMGQDIPAAQGGLLAADHQDGIHLLPGMDLGYLKETDAADEVVEVLKYWKEISIKMRPFGLTREELRLRLDKGTHEIVYRRLFPAYPAPDALAYPYLYGSLLGNGGNYWNQAQPAVDKAIREAQAAAAEIEITRSYRELTDTLDREALLVFIGFYSPGVLLSDKLAALDLSPYDYSASLNMQDFTKLGLAE